MPCKKGGGLLPLPGNRAPVGLLLDDSLNIPATEPPRTDLGLGLRFYVLLCFLFCAVHSSPSATQVVSGLASGMADEQPRDSYDVATGLATDAQPERVGPAPQQRRGDGRQALVAAAVSIPGWMRVVVLGRIGFAAVGIALCACV